MTESPEHNTPEWIDPEEFATLAPLSEVVPPADFEPDENFVDEHSKEEVGGPGGIINYPETQYEVFPVEEEN